MRVDELKEGRTYESDIGHVYKVKDRMLYTYKHRISAWLETKNSYNKVIRMRFKEV